MRLYGIVFTFIALLLPFMQTASAQDLSAAQKKLLNFQQSIIKVKQEQGQFEKDLVLHKIKIEKISTQLPPLEKARKDAKSHFEMAKETTNSAPTAENNAKLKHAEFKFTLADRKYQNTHKQLKKSQNSIKAIESKIEEHKTRTTQTLNAIEVQKKRIKELAKKAKQQAAEQKERTLAIQKLQENAARKQQQEQQRKNDELIKSNIALQESRAEKAVAEQEIVRLKAKLDAMQNATSKQFPETTPSETTTSETISSEIAADSKKVESDSKDPIPTTKIKTETKEAVTQQTAPSTENNTIPTPTTTTESATKTAAIPLPSVTVADDEADKTIQTEPLPTEALPSTLESAPEEQGIEQQKSQAKKLHSAFAERKKKISSKQRRSVANRIMYVKRMENDAVIETSTHSLSYVGTRLFQTEFTLGAGETLFKVGRHEWKRNISAADDNARFVVNLDYEDKTNPRLIIYNKALIQD